MAQLIVPADERRTTPLWRNVSFSLMWTSTAASGFGDRMIMLSALALLGGLLQGVDSTSTQASTQFWFFLPYLFFSTPGGWLADRLPRKWLLLVCDQARGLILLYSWWRLGHASGAANIDAAEHWRVFATLAAIGTFAAVFNPTRNAITPQIMPREQLPAGNAVVTVINIIASLVGMVAGSRLIHQEDIGTVRAGLLLGSMFYLVSGWFFAFMRPTDGGAAFRPRQKIPLGEAARYILTHRRVVQLVAINGVIWPCAALVTSGLFGLGKMRFGMHGQELLGFFAFASAMLGAGMLAGAALVAFIGTRRESAIVYLAALAGAGLAVTLLVTAPWLPLAYAACFGVGLCGGVAIISTTALLQSISPNRIRGRVMGVNSALNTTLSVLVYLWVWRLPDADRNIVWVMTVLGPVLAVGGALLLVRSATQGPVPGRVVNVLWRVDRLYTMAWHRVRFIGRHHVPHTGAVILAANHTTGLDPFVMQAGVPRVVTWLMLRSYQFWFARPLWDAVKPIALEKNSSDLAKVRQIIRALKEGQIVGLFPEGALQRDRRDLKEFEPGIGVIAQRSGARIVPVWIHGTPLARYMLWHFLLPSRTTVVYGEPFEADANADPADVASNLRKRMLELARSVPA